MKNVEHEIIQFSISTWGICLIILVLSGCSSGLKNDTDEWLAKNVIKIDSIAPNYADTLALTFLKSELKDVDIVALGEQTHGDGTTFLAKTMLVKYLHERLGYTVIAFESGMLDCLQTWLMLKAGQNTDSAFERGWFKVWAQSKQTSVLRNYIASDATTTNPLILVGFDMQFSGEAFLNRVNFYQDFLIEHKIDTASFSQVWQVMRLKSYKEIDQIKRDTARQHELLNQAHKLSSIAAQMNCASTEALITQRSISQLGIYLDYLLNLVNRNFQEGNRKDINIRDSIMASNVIWLKEEIFPDCKIILWGANAHVNYNRQLLQYPDEQFVPMGQRLRDHFRNRYYAISFTSYNGQFSSLVNGINPTPQSSNKTLEFQLAHLDLSYAFITSAQLRNGPWRAAFQARPYGYMNYRGDWSNMTDAFFFIKTMEPSIIQ